MCLAQAFVFKIKTGPATQICIEMNVCVSPIKQLRETKNCNWLTSNNMNAFLVWLDPSQTEAGV